MTGIAWGAKTYHVTGEPGWKRKGEPMSVAGMFQALDGVMPVFRTAQYLHLPQMIAKMTTIFELRPAGALGAPSDQTGEDSHKRAECEERIRQLLSNLEGGNCLPPGNTGNAPKADVGETKPTYDSEASLFLLTDRAGPIAEFGSWEDARKYMCDLQISGASIIRVKGKRSQLEAVTAQQKDSALEKRPALRRKWAAAAEALFRLVEPTQ